MLEMGGWLHKCGHFNSSTFLQVAYTDRECYDCKYAREILSEAKELRKKGVSAEPKWRIVFNEMAKHIPVRKRNVDCKARA